MKINSSEYFLILKMLQKPNPKNKEKPPKGDLMALIS